MSSCSLIVISSPSGGGKTTVIRKLLERSPDLSYGVSATTRSPRMSEKNGKDYYFISKSEFKSRMEANDFLEWAKVHGQFYGTLKSQVMQGLKQGKNILLDIDVQGGLAVKKQMKTAVLVFLMPPSMKVLEQRLRKRGTETGIALQKRLKAASQEIQAADQYDYIVYNHDVNQAIHDIQQIIHFKNT